MNKVKNRRQLLNKYWVSYFVLLISCASVSAQSLKDDVGFEALADLLGSALPSGDAVSIIAIEPKVDRLGISNVIVSGWMPDETLAEVDLTGKIISDPAGTSGTTTGHATQTARLLFSNNFSMSPGIQKVDFYHLNDWISSKLIPSTDWSDRIADPSIRTFCPEIITGGLCICNISGTADSAPEPNSNFLRRFDWVVSFENILAVIASGNSSNRSPIIASSTFNGLYVGVTSAQHPLKPAPVDYLYSNDRQRPDLVAPTLNASSATALVSSLASVLIQAASNPSLSQLSTTYAGDPTYNAARAEVLKALLMAGADTQTKNTVPNTFEIIEGEPVTKVISDITGYRSTSGKQTNNGLDTRYGAGQVNIFNSYQMLSAGEQDSVEDGGSAIVSLLGFDYDHEFGVFTVPPFPNPIATYRLPTIQDDTDLHISLVWNVDSYGREDPFINAILYDLDLKLFDITGGQNVLVSSSTSDDSNTENIKYALSSGRDYKFTVNNTKNVLSLVWGYGIAWRVE